MVISVHFAIMQLQNKGQIVKTTILEILGFIILSVSGLILALAYFDILI